MKWQTAASLAQDKTYPAEVYPVSLDARSADGSRDLIGVAGIVLGWSLRETTGAAAAAADLFDSGPDGTPLAAIGLAAGGSQAIGMGKYGIPCRGRLYLTVVSGAFTGAVWFMPFPEGLPPAIEF